LVEDLVVYRDDLLQRLVEAVERGVRLLRARADAKLDGLIVVAVRIEPADLPVDPIVRGERADHLERGLALPGEGDVAQLRREEALVARRDLARRDHGLVRPGDAG